jgi:hypothetical protein
MKDKKTYKPDHIPAWFKSRCYKYTGKTRNQIGADRVVRLALTLNLQFGRPRLGGMFDHYGSFLVDEKRWMIMHAYHYPAGYDLWKIERELDITITIYPIKSWYHPEATVLTFRDGAPKESQHWPEFRELTGPEFLFNSPELLDA